MTLIFKSHCYFGVGESEGWGGGSFGSDLQVDIPSRSGLMSGGQGGTDHLGQRAGPHCSRTPSIKMTFERHVYSGSKNKTKQNVFFRPNYLPSYSRRIPPDGSRHQPPPRAVGPEALPSDSAELWTRWTNRPRCTVTAVSLFFFFWKQEEHLAKRILSSQWNDVRRDLLSRAAAGASLRQAGPLACALCQFSCGKRPSQFRSLLEYSEDSVSKAIKVP